MKRLKHAKESINKTENNNGAKNNNGTKTDNNGTKNFRVVELDIVRGPENKTFNTVVEANGVDNAIEIFYSRFPDAGLHIMVVPEEFVTDHKGFVPPKIAIKVQKKVPLIKLVNIKK